MTLINPPKFTLSQRPVLILRQLLLLFAVMFSGYAVSDIELPPLTGPIVDQANLVSNSMELELSTQLQQLKAQTRVELLVVTVPSLQGYAIENYGYQLGRQWGFSSPEADNAAILITAQQDHAVRIEVGAALKGMLTDAISANIITQIIVPLFRQGRFDDGIKQGVEAIGQVIHGDYRPVKPSQDVDQKVRLFGWAIFIIMLMVVLRSLRKGGQINSRNRRFISDNSNQEFSARNNSGIGGSRFGGGGAVGGW